MKKYFNIFIPIILILISTNVYANGPFTALIKKVALLYEGGDNREYEIVSKEMHFDHTDPAYHYGPDIITILTDESNGLPSGIITGIKFKASMGPSTGWMRQNGTVSDNFGDGYNFLGSPIDLSTIKRKRVTVKFYAIDGLLHATTPGDESL